MFDEPTFTSASNLFGIARDIFIIGAVIKVGWKARDLVQPAIEFFKDVRTFMVIVTGHMGQLEKDMQILLSNDLEHMNSYLKVIAENSEPKDTE